MEEIKCSDEFTKITGKKFYYGLGFCKKYLHKYIKLSFSMQSKDNFMGRFGGEWNWKLGFQAGGNTIIISLLVADIRIDWNWKGFK